MIVKMKKTTLLCLKDDKEKALEQLRDMGVLHIEITKKIDSTERARIEQSISRIDRAVGILTTQTKKRGIKPCIEGLNGPQICDLILKTEDNIAALSKERETLMRDEERLAPWGNFSFATIPELRDRGVYVYLCSGGADVFQALKAEYVCKVVKEDNGKFYFAIVSDKEIDESKLPIDAAYHKNISLGDVFTELGKCRAGIEENENKLQGLILGLGILEGYRNEESEKLEFTMNRDAMEHSGEIAYITGFIPVTVEDEIRRGARENGWALQLSDPLGDDKAPTLLHIPKIFRMAQPIFDFIGVAPGYKEWDISVCFLFFFTIFFAMIVGDGGYGLIMLGATIAARILIKDPKYKLPIRLFFVLSIATVVWGFLTCTWFGIPKTIFPSWFQGLPALGNTKNVQYLCFMIAAIHLSLARAWKAILYFHSIRKALGELGWGMVLWANFFTAVELIVFKGSFPSFAFWLYGIGLGLVLTCAINWLEVGDVFLFPFNLIGSFTDVLSYIRLFAVGLASFYIADSFNKMGLMLSGVASSAVFTVLIGIAMGLIFIFGHGLNMVLAMIAVLVHGIRLNTLEFSNQMGLQWTGVYYKPFKKTDKTKNINKEN